MLDYSQRDAIGLTYILNQVAPDSPFGVEAKKQIAPFRDRDEILTCFDNMEKIIALTNGNEQEIKKLRTHLRAFKNIRGSITKTEVMSQVELFEVKHFLLNFEKLLMDFKKLNVDFVGIKLQPMDIPLAIIDPDGRRIGAFSFNSPELEKIRAEKKRVDASSNIEKWRVLVESELEEETKIARGMSSQLKKHSNLFLTNIENIARLDLTIAKAMLTIKFQAVRPIIGNVLSFKNMSNPFVEGLLDENGQTMTKVSLTMTTGVTMITGANMGGKSVALKTAVLNTVLCQIGFFVFAEAAEIPLFDGICLISEDMQDIGRGLSSFGAEISRFNEIAENVNSQKMFVALDEFARGTNPTEGAAIVRAVASYLHESESICVMTTHYDGVVSPKYRHYQVVGLNLPEGKSDILCIARYMDYSLAEASPSTPPPKDAVNICKMIGLNTKLLDKIENESIIAQARCPQQSEEA